MSDFKPATITSIAHGQIKKGYDQGLLDMHQNIMRQPEGEHEMVIKLKVFRDPQSGHWKVRPSVTTSVKIKNGGPGVESELVINEDGIFQTQKGEQMQLDDLTGKHE